MQTELIVPTYYKQEVIDITSKISQLLPDSGNGLINIFLKHTTAALTVSDLDTGTGDDLLAAIRAISPKINWQHAHEPSHYPDHLWSSIIGVSLTIPFNFGKLLLGNYQRIVLIEFNGPSKRTLSLNINVNKSV